MRALFLLTAALVGEGLFTTAAWDFFLAFSPDQHRVLFCRANDNFTAYDIYETRRGLYFSSTRPRAGGNGKGDIYRIVLRELGLLPGP